jgi:hypothetical protein
MLSVRLLSYIKRIAKGFNSSETSGSYITLYYKKMRATFDVISVPAGSNYEKE